MKRYGKVNREARLCFLRALVTAGVCISIDRSVKEKVDFVFSDTSGRIVLITLNIKGQKISLCNIFAANNCADQL